MSWRHPRKTALRWAIVAVWCLGFGLWSGLPAIAAPAIAAPDLGTNAPPAIAAPDSQGMVPGGSTSVAPIPIAPSPSAPGLSPNPAPLAASDRRELEKLRLEKQITQLIEDRLSRSPEVQDRIEFEVDRAFERTTTILNVLLAILTGIPILVALFVWLLRRSVISELVGEVRSQLEQEVYGELKVQRETAIQDIEKNKAAALVQLQHMVQESTTVLNELKAQIQIANDELDLLKSQATSQIESMVSDAEGVKNQTIQELSALLPNFPQDLIAPDIQPRIGRLTNLLDSLKSAIPQLNFTASDCVKQGNALFFASRYDDAIAAYDRAIQLDPEQYDAWFGRASTLVVQQDYDEALLAYERAIALNPQAAEAWIGQGTVLRKLRHLDTALAAFQQAVQLKPDELRIRLNLASLQLELHEYDAAAATYSSILAQKPDSLKAAIGQVNALRGLNRLADAVAACDRSLATLGTEAELWYLKAVCHAMQQDAPAATHALATAIRFNASYQETVAADPAFDGIRTTSAFLARIPARSNDPVAD